MHGCRAINFEQAVLTARILLLFILSEEGVY